MRDIRASSEPSTEQCYSYLRATIGSTSAALRAGTGSNLRVSGGAFVFEDTTMAELAQKLSQLSAVNGLVVDQTGISGSFEFRIRMAADEEIMRSEALHGEAPSIFPLIERQLGVGLHESDTNGPECLKGIGRAAGIFIPDNPYSESQFRTLKYRPGFWIARWKIRSR